ncbi:TetR/AcrR family transcriptional regulator [Cryomorpha ignava]|uniref:TetR/AcrR family transcriptional regulator n=1 Tax=Cryomorpha ignava TaxID=101383 RepID=A0A7K3WNB3_9FLAO|nr:TetR/AcrR family transcriptional regulator [Cryomorpha ignava]NEN23139.1 TetR/AcrR family transcriptional regulator [Cryomorpha ignava]
MSEENLSKEDQLIKDAIDVFLTYGIKSVTMDDVARHLRVSKKTIYQFVKDKEDLVNRCVRRDCNSIENSVQDIQAQNLKAIDENFAISSVIVEELKNIHPSIFYDLEKYYPEAMAMMVEMRHDFIGGVMRQNLNKGISEGVYRPELNVEIMTQLWVLRLNVIFNPKLFPMDEFHPKDVYLEMFIHHIRGIANAKGLKELEKNLNKNAKP